VVQYNKTFYSNLYISVVHYKLTKDVGNTYLRGKLSTVDVLFKVACFVKKVYIFKIKLADLN
jgi:hypothetical protein